jgi:ABC-2 type transport system permease protein
MRNIWTIAKREFNAYFNSPVAYVLAAMVLVVCGIVMALNISYAMQNPGFAPTGDTVTGVIIFMLVFAVPALTMRLLADETRLGTIELLLTRPVRDIEVVTGKWLGAMLFILTLLAFTLIYPLLLNTMVDPGIDFGLVWAGYIGLILASGGLVAIGILISSLFSNLVAAFLATMGSFVVIWFLLGAPAQMATGQVAEFFRYVDYRGHFLTLSRGVLELTDILYYASAIVIFLVMSSVSLETRRWR